MIKRHLIPDLPSYSFDAFEDFANARTELTVAALKALNESWHVGTDAQDDDEPVEFNMAYR